ncbi:unnamed protein product, partial [Mesorhabditis spiculigera]
MDHAAQMTDLGQFNFEQNEEMQKMMQVLLANMPPLTIPPENMENVASPSEGQSSHSSGHVFSQSPAVGDENALPMMLGTPSQLNQTTTSEKPETASKPSDGWFQCFSTQSQLELDALIYSLFAAPRVEKKGDGFDHYECLNRSKFKCRFRLRVKRINDWHIVEERSGHSHSADLAAIPTQGLAKSIREIVDQSFHEDWPTSLRQERIEQEMRRLGLPANPRLSRQIDNRVSYLRRVKNLSEVKRIQEENDVMDHLQALKSQLQQTPTKNIFSTPTENSPFKPVIPGGQAAAPPMEMDINAILSQLQQQHQFNVSPLRNGNAGLDLVAAAAAAMQASPEKNV